MISNWIFTGNTVVISNEQLNGSLLHVGVCLSVILQSILMRSHQIDVQALLLPFIDYCDAVIYLSCVTDGWDLEKTNNILKAND